MAPGRHSDFISSMSGSDLQGWQDSGGTQEAINVSAGALTPGCCPVHWNRAVAMLAKPWVDWPKITAPDEFPLTLQEKYVCGEVAGRASGRRVHFSVLSPYIAPIFVAAAPQYFGGLANALRFVLRLARIHARGAARR